MRDSREGTKPKNIHVRNRTHASRHEKYTQRHVLIMPMIPVRTHILHATVQMVQQIGSTYQERAWRTVGHHCVHKRQCGTRRRRRDNDVHDRDSRREEIVDGSTVPSRVAVLRSDTWHRRLICFPINQSGPHKFAAAQHSIRIR